MSFEEDSLGSPNEILPAAEETLKNNKENLANDVDFSQELGKVGDLLHVIEKVGGFDKKQAEFAKNKVLKNSKLQQKVGYNDAQFEKSVSDWTEAIVHQTDSILLAIYIARFSMNPTQGLKDLAKHPGKLKAAIATLETTARMRIDLSEGKNLRPEEERNLAEKTADFARRVIKPIDQINIAAAKGFIALLEKTGFSSGEGIDPQFFSVDRWSKPEFQIAYALTMELAHQKEDQLVKDHIKGIRKKEHDQVEEDLKN